MKTVYVNEYEGLIRRIKMKNFSETSLRDEIVQKINKFNEFVAANPVCCNKLC